MSNRGLAWIENCKILVSKKIDNSKDTLDWPGLMWLLDQALHVLKRAIVHERDLNLYYNSIGK